MEYIWHHEYDVIKFDVTNYDVMTSRRQNIITLCTIQDVLKYDVTKYDVMKYDYMKYGVIKYDIMNYDIIKQARAELGQAQVSYKLDL